MELIQDYVGEYEEEASDLAVVLSYADGYGFGTGFDVSL